MTAPVICCMLLIAASFGERRSRDMSDWQFSTTTIASSTNEPMTRISPNIDSTFTL